MSSPDSHSAHALILLAYALLLLAIVIVDIKTRRIPSRLLLPLAALAVVDAALLPAQGPGLASAVVGAGVGFGGFYMVYLGGKGFASYATERHSNFKAERAFGFGDARLMGVVGLIAGFPGVLYCMLFALFAGGVCAIGLMLLGRLRRGKREAFQTMPFAPAIVIGSAIALMLDDQLRLFGVF